MFGRSRGNRKVLAVIIAFLGLTLTGIVIAVAVQAATLALGNSRG
jgi:hypothetical protein